MPYRLNNKDCYFWVTVNITYDLNVIIDWILIEDNEKIIYIPIATWDHEHEKERYK